MLDLSPLTAKDRRDLAFGLELGVDWVALSFARRGEDIRFIKNLIANAGKNTRVIAKIETPEGLKNLDDIIALTDAVMVARGDLGVEVKMEEVPMAQKLIVEKCNKAGKPVIVATQMMESMITAPRPTRAETSDVANAVIDGADAVMLSAESAAGRRRMVVTGRQRRARQRAQQFLLLVIELGRGLDDDLDDEITASGCPQARHRTTGA